MISKEQILFLANVLTDKFINLFGRKTNVKSILVVKLDEIGDMVACTHVFENLKKQYPNSNLMVLCKPFVTSLIQNDPFVDSIITDTKFWNSRFDLVVELRGNWTTLIKSFMYFPKYRLSRAQVRLKNKGNQLHEYKTNYEVIKQLIDIENPALSPKLYFSEQNILNVNEYIKENNLNKIAIFHVGARKKLRQWKLDNFVQVASFLHLNYQTQIVFIGSGDDQNDISQVMQQLEFKSYSIVDKLNLVEFAYLCSKSYLYIGNESGPLQIASLYSIPIFALFGPGVPNVFYPVGEHVKIFHHVLDCNPCDQINCVVPDNPCINRISVEDVCHQMVNILK